MVRSRQAGWVRALALLTLTTPLPGAVPAGAQTLEATAAAVATAWADPTLESLERLLDPVGALLEVDGREHARLTPRRVVAAVADLRRGLVSGAASVVRAVDVGGDPAQAFVELAWETVESGTTEPRTRRIYVGLVERENRFWISEIRILSE